MGGRINNARKLAQSALLSALRSERRSVFELEVMATSIQLNNTALSDVVESLDALVGELNDMVAIFEEEIVVLKATLRKLQREMRDKAPSHAKVEEDLKTAKDDIIIRAELNLTAIGSYVNQLEERLSSFTVARRDTALREERCTNSGLEVARLGGGGY